MKPDLQVVEVHQGSSDTALFYSVGTLNQASSPLSLKWGDSTPFDNGISPSVSTNASGTVVEVHANKNGSGALYYTFGSIDGTEIKWDGAGRQFDTGSNPSVSLNDNGDWLVVHNPHKATSELYYNYSQGTGWNKSHRIPNVAGTNPSVSWISESTAVLVYQTSDGSEILYQFGTVAKDKVEWGNPGTVATAGGIITFDSPSVGAENFVNPSALVTCRQPFGLQSWIGSNPPNFQWSTPEKFTTGRESSISLAGAYAVEVHQNSDGDELYYLIGEPTDLNSPHRLTSGRSPSVSCAVPS